MNLFSVTLIDTQERLFEGNGSAIEASIAAFPDIFRDNSTAILGIESNGSGSIVIEWTALVATNSDSVPLYEINVTLADTGEASIQRHSTLKV